MAFLFVRHKVNEFHAWKAAYNAFDAERKSMGVTGDGVYQGEDDPNDVTDYQQFNEMSAAKGFAGSERLQTVMENAGVVGSPDMWFANRV